MTLGLPFISESDPLVSGEGVLDPLGLSSIGDRLADQILPGLRARMWRVRFVTAIAVAASVCDGLEDEIAADNVTPASIAFEWLLTEAFARGGAPDLVRRTPGIDKARTARQAGLHMSAKTYLKVPSVFGLHGVYKPLARHLGVVDDELRLSENGHALLDVWEREQGVAGFIERAAGGQNGGSLRTALRSAVVDALAKGYADRSGGWQGWSFFLEHLLPSRIGPKEAALLERLLRDAKGETRRELLDLVNAVADDADIPESSTVEQILPKASAELTLRLARIQAYERFCGHVELGFGYLRWLSTQNRDQAISPSAFASIPTVQRTAAELPASKRAVERALETAPAAIAAEFDRMGEYFQDCATAQHLYQCLMRRHADVQKQKPPDGKREWFEHAADDQVMVRIRHRLTTCPEPSAEWPRPYRLKTLRYFSVDLRRAIRG